MTDDRARELLLRLIPLLCDERGMRMKLDAEASVSDLFATFRALVNTREPMPAAPELLALQDELLQGMIASKGIATLEDATPSANDPRLLLWRGDITRLAADAIVNAANNQMLGCWVPGHHCIDNAIHTFAGIQLRIECAELMRTQGHEEPTGEAKVTAAYNLPAKAVIHTVGPIAQGHPSVRHKLQLQRCYESCLDAAQAHDLHSIAFCCISTGVFGYPCEAAAEVAVETVRRWLADHPGTDMRVVFNVFLEKDELIYRRLIGPLRAPGHISHQ